MTKKLRVFFGRQVETEKLTFWRIFALQVVLFFAVYGIMLVPRFSTDSYSVYFYTSGGLNGILESGRTATYLLDRALLAMGLNSVTLSPVFTAVFSLTVSWSAAVMLSLLKPYFPRPNRLTVLLLELGVALAYANIYFAEWYFFSDVALMYAFAILFMTLALLLFFHRNRIAGSILALVCMYISLSFYQASLGFFMIFGSMLILLRHDVLWTRRKDQNNRPCVREFLRLVVTGGGSSAAIVLAMCVLETAGFASSRGPSQSVADIFNSARQMLWQFSYYYPSGYPDYLTGLLKIIFVLSGPALLCLLAGSFSKKRRDSFSSAVLTLLALAAGLAFVFAPHAVAKSVWMPPRSICSFFALFTVMAVVTGYNYAREGKAMPVAGTVVTLLLLIANITAIQGIACDQIKVNRKDRAEAEEIVRYIQEYEAESGRIVDTISWSPDSQYTWTYPEIKYSIMDMNVRAGARSWSLIDCIGYYAGRRFNSETMPDEIWASFFLGQEWNSFQPEEQIRFQENRMYLMVY